MATASFAGRNAGTVANLLEEPIVGHAGSGITNRFAPAGHPGHTRFLAAVPDRKRSALVARLLEGELRRYQERLEGACRAANRDASLAAETEEWQAFDDPLPRVAEP